MAHGGSPGFDGASYPRRARRQPRFDQRRDGDYDKLTGRRGLGFLALSSAAGSRRRSTGEESMKFPSIDIEALPLLDTAVGLFGSLVGESASSGPSVFELAVTVALIIYD
jgi:hypothetical protein